MAVRFGFLRTVGMCLTALCAFVVSGRPSFAQVPSRISQSVENSPKIRVSGSVPHALSRAVDLGVVASDLPLKHILLVLQPSDQQKRNLSTLVGAQNDPNSAQYHQWLQPGQFAARFAPSSDDLRTVSTWLESRGFQIDEVSKGGLWIQFSGTAAQVSSTFQTEIHRYQIDGQERISNASEIALPSALAQVVVGISSLNNIPRTPLHTRVHSVILNSAGKLATNAVAHSNETVPEYTTGSGNHYLSPGDMAAIYDTKPLLANSVNGTGISIAVIGQTDIQMADIESFRSIFSLPQNNPQVITVGADPGVSSSDEVESDLDLEYAGALAPQANLLFVEAGSTSSSAGIDLAAAYAVDNRVAPILTLSYGACESALGTAGNSFYNSLWGQASAEGMTVFVSSGDSGSAGCDGPEQGFPAVQGLAVNGIASTPYSVAVGGAEFNEPSGSSSTYWNSTDDATYSSAIGYIPEKVWNESCDRLVDPSQCSVDGGSTVLYAGGGGQSVLYPKPLWQAGAGVPNDSTRDLPDLVLAAAGQHDGYLICNEGSCQTIYQNGKVILYQASVVGGTSAAAPSMAGIMALLEQKNGLYQGQANNTFYRLAASQSAASCNSSNLLNPTTPTSCVFHDITASTNSVPCFALTPNCSATVSGTDGLLSGFPATAGYDLASGLGSVDANNLVNAWQSTASISTTISLQSSQSNIQHGAPFNFQVSVLPTSGSGIPTGAFSLNANNQFVAPFTLTGGRYSGSTRGLPGGTYSLLAHYAGDGTYQSSDSQGLNVTVTPEASTVTLKAIYFNLSGSSFNINGPIPFGDPIYLTATMVGQSGQGTPSGELTLFMDGNAFATVPLDSTGQVSVFIQNYLGNGTVLAGSHTFTASYSGDSSFLPSSASSGITVTITKGQCYTFATPNVTSVAAGQPVQVTISALSASSSFPATGTLQLYDNGVALGPLFTIGSGLSEYTSSALSVGKHVLTASYSGDANYVPTPQGSFYQFSNTLTVTSPTLPASTTTLTQSAASVSVGQSVSYTVTVANSASGKAIPTGTVTVINAQPGAYSSTLLNATTLTNGSLQFTLPFYTAGSLELFASYSGDSNYSPSISSVLKTTIQTIAPTVALSPTATYVLPGQQSVLNFTVTGKPNNSNYSVPTGYVQYYDSFNGGTPQLITTDSISLGNGQIGVDSLAVKLMTGSHTITATYSGDSVWSAETVQTMEVVSTPDFILGTASGTALLPVGGNVSSGVSVTPTLGYSANVTFTCGSGVPVGISCTVAPTSIALSGPTTANVTLTSAVAHAALTPPLMRHTDEIQEAGVLLSGLGLVSMLCLYRRRAFNGALLLIVGIGLLITGCASPVASQYTVSLTSANGVRAAQGSNVQLLVNVQGNVGGTVKSGSVTFYDGSTPLGVATVNNGTATMATQSLTVGVHSLSAVYIDSRQVTATSNTVNQAMTGGFVVTITATSGTVAHSIPLNFQLQ